MVYEEEDYKKKIDFYMQIQASSFEKATTYTNIIMVAGYVVFYTVWSKSEEYLSDFWFVLSALLVTVSTFVFVCFEVYKSLIFREELKGLNEVFDAPPDQFDKKIYDQRTKEAHLTNQANRVWIVVFPVTLITGLIGSAIVMFGFVTFLFVKN